MILPTIHMNGTDAQQLLDGYVTAMIAVSRAVEAIHAVEFNARDYYAQGPKAWTQACEDRLGMLQAMEKVRSDLGEHAAHCDAAIKEKKRAVRGRFTRAA